MTISDEAVAPRRGEFLDSQKIGDFLKQNVKDLDGDISIKQFPSGYSNLTYLICVGERELVLRRPPFGRKAKTAHDMHREYRMLTALRPVFPYCPEPLVYSEDESVIGSPFFVMERIKGIILRKDLPPGLTLDDQQMKKLCENLLDLQFRLHSVDYCKIGLENIGKPEGYTQRQVMSWIERYEGARTPDTPDFHGVIDWLKKRIPKSDSSPALIHNDFKLDNIVLNEENPLEIIGVLDWEMATIGDPLMDLGNSLAYWVEADDPPEMELVRLMPTNMPGALTRVQMLDRYRALSGRPIDNFDFYLCFGLFRLAVIAQQIYYRYYHGQTRDARFKELVRGVAVLENAAVRVLSKSAIT
ncbi:MAG: hypothetical protein QG577_2807 [Thermodesulfobacteriota bacterium]|nr:hypothetical protein [Thermodesulfobacteriota bacterium]